MSSVEFRGVRILETENEYFSCSKVSDAGLDSLQGGLRRMPSLKKIMINFSEYRE